MPLLMTGLLTKAVPLAVKAVVVVVEGARWVKVGIDTVDTLNRGVQQVRKRRRGARKDAPAPDDGGGDQQ